MVLLNPLNAFAEAKAERGVADSKADLYVEEPSKMISYVDNNKGIVSLYDFAYRLKSNTKVDGSRKKLVNRYALKKGSEY
jgi:hypothetical protein